MLWITPQHRFQNRDDLVCVFGRPAIQTPQLPRVQVHQTFCVKGSCVQVVWVDAGAVPDVEVSSEGVERLVGPNDAGFGL